MQSVNTAKMLAYNHHFLLQKCFMNMPFTETIDDLWKRLPQTEKDWFLEMRDVQAEMALKVYGNEIEAYNKELALKHKQANKLALENNLLKMGMQKVKEK